jgi:maltose O-acetyltransferase
MKRSALLPTRDYLCNHFVSQIPIHSVRMAAYRRLGIRIGDGSTILMSTEIQCARDLVVGKHTIINRHCLLDARGGLTIHNNVNISSHVLIVAGTHDIQDAENFAGAVHPIVIEDYVWLCTRSLLLPGVTIGRGAVVAAGAVVTRSVAPQTVVAGVPARKIGERNSELCYTLTYDPSWQ